MFKAIKALLFRRQQHQPYDMDEYGLKVYCGAQGAGKTLSAIRYVKSLCYAYPAAILVTNVLINDLPCWTEVYEYEGIEDLFRYSNGTHGVIYLIDEIHLEFNSLESKNIPISTVTEVSQLRKQRKVIVGTSQVAMRIAKPLREQFDYLIDCSNIFGVIQVNRMYDNNTIVQNEAGELDLDNSKSDLSIWIHDWRQYVNYDTFAKMRRYTRDISAQLKKYDEELYKK